MSVSATGPEGRYVSKPATIEDGSAYVTLT
jgi:hypothetical protein